MSGRVGTGYPGGLPYADRPFAYVRDPTTGGVYASPDFLQFLERLVKTVATPPTDVDPPATVSTTTAMAAAPTVATTTAQAAPRIGDVLAGRAPFAGSVDSETWQTAQIASMLNRFPVQTVLDPASAIELIDGGVGEVITVPTVHGLFILIGVVHLTGPGAVTAATASVGFNPGVIETAPAAFATSYYGAPAVSPANLGTDLSIGTIIQQLRVDIPGQAYLNVVAAFNGDISAYGSLIVWRVGD